MCIRDSRHKDRLDRRRPALETPHDSAPGVGFDAQFGHPKLGPAKPSLPGMHQDRSSWNEPGRDRRCATAATVLDNTILVELFQVRLSTVATSALGAETTGARRPEAVSYTHLDVYKRQQTSRPPCVPSMTLPASIASTSRMQTK